jgi:hypothetical protein
VIVFAITGAAVLYVYVQIHKDPALSCLTSTKEGRLDPQFWFQIIGAGGDSIANVAGEPSACDQSICRQLF